eukprot:3658069-Amphidinium_carterae.1
MTRRKLGNEKYYERTSRESTKYSSSFYGSKVQQQLLRKHQPMTGLRGLRHHQDLNDKLHYLDL